MHIFRQKHNTSTLKQFFSDYVPFNAPYKKDSVSVSSKYCSEQGPLEDVKNIDQHIELIKRDQLNLNDLYRINRAVNSFYKNSLKRNKSVDGSSKRILGKRLLSNPNEDLEFNEMEFFGQYLFQSNDITTRAETPILQGHQGKTLGLKKNSKKKHIIVQPKKVSLFRPVKKTKQFNCHTNILTKRFFPKRKETVSTSAKETTCSSFKRVKQSQLAISSIFHTIDKNFPFLSDSPVTAVTPKKEEQSPEEHYYLSCYKMEQLGIVCPKVNDFIL
jgi:hypothetical protein